MAGKNVYAECLKKKSGGFSGKQVVLLVMMIALTAMVFILWIMTNPALREKLFQGKNPFAVEQLVGDTAS